MKLFLRLFIFFCVFTYSNEAQSQAQVDSQTQNYINRLKREAEEGNTSANIMLGHLYKNGYDYSHRYRVEKDPYEAMDWYKKAGEAGYPSGYYNLGVMYQEGEGVDKSPEIAFIYFTNTIKTSDGPPYEGYAFDARYKLAEMYLNGIAVPRELKTAEGLLINLLDNEPDMTGIYYSEPYVNFLLGEVYLSSDFESFNVDRALNYYRKSADFRKFYKYLNKWDENAYIYEGVWKLAMIYKEGKYVKKDLAKYEYYLKKAASFYNNEETHREYFNYLLTKYSGASSFEETVLLIDGLSQLHQAKFSQAYPKIIELSLNTFYNSENTTSRDSSLAWLERFLMQAKDPKEQELTQEIGYLLYAGSEVYSKSSKSSIVNQISNIEILPDPERGVEFMEMHINPDSENILLNTRLVLGEAYLFGKGVEADKTKALNYIGDLDTKELPFIDYWLGLSSSGSEALNYFYQSAMNGFYPAIRKWLDYEALHYYTYAGIDTKEGKEKLNSPDFKKLAISFAYAGIITLNRKEFEKGKELLEIAAESKDPYALAGMGYMYFKGLGVEKDNKKAREYLELTAGNDLQFADHYYGLLLEEEEEYDLAYKFISRCCDRYNYEARLKQAEMIYNGRGTEKDEIWALINYEKLAKQGVTEAQYITGKAFLFGEHLKKKDKEEAEYFLGRAKDRGHQEATALYEKHKLSKHKKTMPSYGW